MTGDVEKTSRLLFRLLVVPHVRLASDRLPAKDKVMLWHADIRLPETARLPKHRVELCWTKHALHARETDRYGVIPYFPSIPLSKFQVIEVETNEYGSVSKWLVRGHYDAERDVVFALLPGDQFWTVKTVWYNLRSDQHKTLDRSRYQA